jgi:hypothetical protein
VTVKLRGKWAQGIQPRDFSWVIKDVLAVCERPGGYGANHRRVRRQEEIVWLREQGFQMIVSIIPAPHNLHNYDEMRMPYQHLGLELDEVESTLATILPALHHLVVAKQKSVVHSEGLDDRVGGVVGAYLRWSGLVPEGPKAVSVTESIVGRQLEALGRDMVAMAPTIPGAPAKG